MAPRNQFPARMSTDSATDGFAITPSDTTDLAEIPRGVWVGVGGNVVITLASGDVTLKNVPSGELLPVRPTRVKATGTTATDIVGLL